MANGLEGAAVNQLPLQTSYLVPAPTDGLEHLLREVPEGEQPLARLEKLGPAALATPELLHLMLDARADPLLPLRLLTTWTTLNAMAHANPLDLLRVEGMTHLRSARLRAALELGLRVLSEQAEEHSIIRSPADAAALLLPQIGGLPQEQLHIMMLNTKNRVLGTTMVYQGSVHTTVVRITELFREAVRQNSTAIIVAHSHPSGDPSPSPEDQAITMEIVKAGKLLDIDVMDHLILAGNRWVSLKERGIGFT